MAQPLINAEQREAFRRDGFVRLPGFYDCPGEIEPIQRAIYELIGILIGKYGFEIERPAFSPENFDAGYLEMIARDRRIGGELYDAIKQIPAFIRLLSSSRHEQLMKEIRQSDLVGIAAGGHGIRIDPPGEEKFRSPWHQDYVTQFRSMDGITFWSPLVPTTAEMGPVIFCVGSQQDGPAPIQYGDPDHPEKTDSYAAVIHNHQERVARYPHAAPASEPGDLILIDFLNVHASGANVSNRARWSMQMRYFNYREPNGIRNGWCGSFAAGVAVKDIHPELVVG